MSNKLLIIYICLLADLSCKKKEAETPIAPKDVTGKWKWEVTYPYTPTGPVIPVTPQSTGIDEIVTYYPNKTWSKKQNNVLVDTGNYSIGHASRRLDPNSVAQIDSIQYYQSNGVPIAGRIDYYYIIVDSMNFYPGLGGVGPGDSKWLIRQ